MSRETLGVTAMSRETPALARVTFDSHGVPGSSLSVDAPQSALASL